MPVWADINFLKSKIESVGQHLTLCLFPNLSFATTSINTGAYELCTSFPSLTKSRTCTSLVLGKYWGLYSKMNTTFTFGISTLRAGSCFKTERSLFTSTTWNDGFFFRYLVLYIFLRVVDGWCIFEFHWFWYWFKVLLWWGFIPFMLLFFLLLLLFLLFFMLLLFLDLFRFLRRPHYL